MIAMLRGQLVERGDDTVVVDVAGVGYLVSMSRISLEGLGAEGSDVALRIHTHVREDMIQLFGFLGEEEREAFESLIGLNGVGPKAAMGILSGIEPRELARAVCEEDLARLCLVPGIGKKKAERMVLELKEKLLGLARPSDSGGDDGGRVLKDLRSALSNLGFKTVEIERVVGGFKKKVVEGATLDELVPEALKLLRD
ncbi:MAG: Holliday junction branch migration protein RuvA [Deltaproteobacteria bacterium]|nr:Holliday junction branch migration protein RuvA [Deltaproteobacteria bacterium]